MNIIAWAQHTPWAERWTVARLWPVGVLYNRDPRFAQILMELLHREEGLVVGDNEPYRLAEKGRDDAPSSGHPHGDRTQKVALADVNAAMAQDRVGDCDVEIEVRQHEMVEVIVAFHVALVGRAEGERDLTIGRRIDLLAVERLQIGDRFCETRLELIDRRLIVFVARRFDAGEARRAVLGLICGNLHLTGKRKHVGRKPRI